MLTRLYIDNYKCFSNLELELGPLQLLLGANGTGKSSVLDVIAELQTLLTGRSTIGFSPTLTRWQTRTVQTFEVDVQRPSDNATFRYHVEIEIDYPKPSRTISRESLTCDGRALYRTENGVSEVLLNGAWNRVLVPPFSSGVSFAPLGNAEITWLRTFMSRMLILRPSPASMSAIGKEEDYLQQNASNFVAWYRGIEPHQHFENKQALHTKLGQVLSGFNSLRLLKSAEQQQRILSTSWRTDMGSDSEKYEVFFGELSDGQRMLILLYSLICLLPTPGDDAISILLDEPTNFVSLAEIEPWLREVEELTEEQKLQAIIVSHNSEVVNAWAPSHGIHFLRNGAGPVRTRPFSTHDDDPLTPAERIARGWDDEHA